MRDVPVKRSRNFESNQDKKGSPGIRNERMLVARVI